MQSQRNQTTTAPPIHLNKHHCPLPKQPSIYEERRKPTRYWPDIHLSLIAVKVDPISFDLTWSFLTWPNPNNTPTKQKCDHSHPQWMFRTMTTMTRALMTNTLDTSEPSLLSTQSQRTLPTIAQPIHLNKHHCTFPRQPSTWEERRIAYKILTWLSFSVNFR